MMQGADPVELHMRPLSLIRLLQQDDCEQEKGRGQETGRGVLSSGRPMMGP